MKLRSPAFVTAMVFVAMVQLYDTGGGRKVGAPMQQMYVMRIDQGGCNRIAKDIKEFYAKLNAGITASVSCKTVKKIRLEVK